MPGASQTLEPSVDVFGNEVQRNGGNNTAVNIFLNPANVTEAQTSAAGQEIKKLYDATGDKTVIPRVAPNYVGSSDNTLTSSEKTTWQKTAGKGTEEAVTALLKNDHYNTMNNAEKAEIINDVIQLFNDKAKGEYFSNKGTEYEQQSSYKNAAQALSAGIDISTYTIAKKTLSGMKSDKDSEGKSIANSLSIKKACLY